MTDMNRIPICERLLSDALTLEGDFEPDDPNAEIYLRQVAQLRADAKLIESLVEALEQLVDECNDEGFPTSSTVMRAQTVLHEADPTRADRVLSQAHTEVLLDEQRDRANAADAAPRHSVSDPSHSSVSRPYGECRLSQGEEK
jgi:hypothetical protein